MCESLSLRDALGWMSRDCNRRYWTGPISSRECRDRVWGMLPNVQKRKVNLLSSVHTVHSVFTPSTELSNQKHFYLICKNYLPNFLTNLVGERVGVSQVLFLAGVTEKRLTQKAFLKKEHTLYLIYQQKRIHLITTSALTWEPQQRSNRAHLTRY